MSRIGSSSASAVRVAAQPLSNVFTVLLLIGALALALAAVMLWVTLEKRYGVTFGVTDAGKAALDAPARARQAQEAREAELKEMLEKIRRFPEPIKLGAPGEAAPAPAVPAAPAPAVPEAPAAPAVPTEGAPAAPAPAAPAAPAEGTPPAPAAPTEPAPAAPAAAPAAPAVE